MWPSSVSVDSPVLSETDVSARQMVGSRMISGSGNYLADSSSQLPGNWSSPEVILAQLHGVPLFACTCWDSVKDSKGSSCDFPELSLGRTSSS